QPGTIWIDSTCIKQQDTLECNAQVRIIKHIYTKVQGDIVWLGVTQKCAAQALPVITRLSNLRKNEDPISSRDALTAQDLSPLEIPSPKDPAWKDLETIFWKPWFSRLGII
ncbi:hypothetical protein M433DRAFT_71143, partial [Acidomyces richmondensis BFW]